ncbi:hypothetical protein [Acidovorax sp. FG27]|uniref:hypothetical protein n=1 Tax=Acidovorax sp. FG27 TaxID=3133652 RepID=UPI0033404301
MRTTLAQITAALQSVAETDRAAYFKANRANTWGNSVVVEALKKVVGNKCWYSEISLGGADQNIDHFRPKGRVVEIDDQMAKTGQNCEGYWWLAFEPLNFRLTSQHSNQRRVDDTTEGGKADFFPIRGMRTPATTPYAQIFEDVLPLDPCSASDVSLMWFDPDGNPVYLPKKKRMEEDALRIKATIWLYHLDKRDTAAPRRKAVESVQLKLKQADTYHQLWNSPVPCMKSKASFDKEVAEIAELIADDSEFAGAKRCTVRLESANYQWIDECQALRI